MNLHGIAVLVCVALFHEATCLQCFQCSQTMAGCTPGLSMDDTLLHACDSTAKFCVTQNISRFKSDGTSSNEISLLCQSDQISGCKRIDGGEPVEYVTICSTFCATDGCNAHSLTPTKTPEVATTPANTITKMTTPEDNQTAAPPPASTDAPKPSPDKGTTAILKPTGFTDAPKTTTSAAQALRLTMHTFCNLFVSIMCALHVSGLNRND